MDTKTVAAMLGTDTRVLRRFLRDKRSTFQAVGSGSRYEFTETDVPELQRRFKDWMGNKQPSRAPATVVVSPIDAALAQQMRDRAVWAEEDKEGVIRTLEDLRDPRVRAKVQRVARAQEQRLNDLLMAAGLHLSQRQHYQAA